MVAPFMPQASKVGRPRTTDMRAVWISLAVIVPAQVIVTYLQAVMGTAPVSVFDGAVILAIGAVFFSTIEIEEQTPDFARQ